MNLNLSNTNTSINGTIDNGRIILPRNTALWAGIFYVLTFISIPTLSLFQPIHDPNYLLSNANDNYVVIGGILEIIVALCGIITAIILYSVFKKQNQTLAIGLIAARIVEAGTMFVGVAFLYGAVSLHKSSPDVSFIPIAQTLVAMYDRIFVLGQGFMPAIDDLLLGILIYKSRIAPRGLALIGIIGAFPLFAGYFGILFGLFDRTSPLAVLSALMVAIFEFSFGIYMIVTGIRKKS